MRNDDCKKILKAFDEIDKVLERGEIGPIFVSPYEEKELREYIDKKQKEDENLRLILDGK